MFHVLDDRNISLKLSEVLSEIGVNERMVKIRRKFSLLHESFSKWNYKLNNANDTEYHFGSRSEGTTTLGLKSDADVVFCFGDALVIQDWADWKPGIGNLLMVQDETTSPGYCLLQLLRNDTPEAESDVPDDAEFRKDNKGRILHKNAWANSIYAELGMQRNGPAGSRRGEHGNFDVDVVPAYHCDSWPIEGRGWLDRQCVGNWPSMDIKNSSVSTGCLLVPVGSNLNNLNDVEWRISTSMAERLMMFNLNITQIRCYVMMKIISKTFFTMNGECIITSFMCKCTLFHCIQNTHAYYWREDNLFSCVMKCICTLRDCVLNLNCPHHIIPSNNLMERRINAEQQRHLLNVLHSLIMLNIDMFFAIEFDDLGTRIQMKLTNVLPLHRNVSSQIDIETDIVQLALLNFGLGVCKMSHNSLLKPCDQGLPERAFNLVNGIQRLQSQYHTFSDVEAEACIYIAPLLASHIGSILASYSVYRSNTVSPEAIWWFSAGFESDVSSSRLKLASAFYCAEDINHAESLLSELEYKYSDVVMPVCGCYMFKHEVPPAEWGPQLYRNNELLNKMIAYCVIFSRCETSIIPQELRQELFRSTDEEYQHRSNFDAIWMDFAVIDSLPYMYYLQYKVYKHLGHHQKQRKALSNLLKTTLNAPYLGHRETAWNLLGQCMEQQIMPVEALWCYERSLEIRPHNNAAYFHKARLQRL